LVDIVGDLRDPSMLISDREIVRTPFKHFRDTGEFQLNGFD
jgi:hypothetical protein